MRYSEFERELEKLGFFTSHSPNRVEVTQHLGYGTLVHVSNRHEHMFDTIYTDFRLLSNIKQLQLYNLIKRYAETPLNDREDVERYVYAQPTALGATGYLNIVDYGGDNERVMFSTPDNTDMYRAQFTDDEVDELSLAYRQLIGICKKVNVKDLQN